MKSWITRNSVMSKWSNIEIFISNPSIIEINKAAYVRRCVGNMLIRTYFIEKIVSNVVKRAKAVKKHIKKTDSIN